MVAISTRVAYGSIVIAAQTPILAYVAIFPLYVFQSIAVQTVLANISRVIALFAVLYQTLLALARRLQDSIAVLAPDTLAQRTVLLVARASNAVVRTGETLLLRGEVVALRTKGTYCKHLLSIWQAVVVFSGALEAVGNVAEEALAREGVEDIVEET